MESQDTYLLFQDYGLLQTVTLGAFRLPLLAQIRTLGIAGFDRSYPVDLDRLLRQVGKKPMIHLC